jgi:curved DNA-binding protein CbpA
LGQLENAYRTLGLRPGASFDEIKRARRRLAMKWHPDRHSTNPKRLSEAESRIKEINAAYSYLKRIKNTSARRNQQRSRSSSKSYAYQRTQQQHQSYTRQRRSKSYQQSSADQSRKQQQRNRRQESKASTSNDSNRRAKSDKNFDQTWFDRLATRITNWRFQRGLSGSRKRKVRNMYKQINKERKRWKEDREKFQRNTRVGVYSSLFNALVFGKLVQNQDNQTTSLGGYNANDKYDIILRHSIIRDYIFYAFNRGFNLFFKYTLCILFISQILLLIYQNFRYGIFWGEVGEFVANQSMVITMLAVLFLPDNLYQRYLLWNFRNVSLKRVRQLFKNKRLPEPHEYYKNWMLIGKYSMISGLIWFFY